jgi:hypothetical protein
MDMNRNSIENVLVIFLFVMVLVVFSFAQKDSKKLDRLYNTSQLIQKQAPVHTVQAPLPTAKTAHN